LRKVGTVREDGLTLAATGGIAPTLPTYDQAMADTGTPDAGAAAGPSLAPGTHVEAQSGLDGSWQAGFVVEEVTATGYRLRREMDDALLPDLPHERVRRRRKRSTWWV
jgi:hypothetical protein